MKNRQYFTVALLALSTVVYGQDSNRLALERRLEIAYAKTAVFTADSPLLDRLMQSARSANPDVGNEVWRSLRPEFSEAATSVLMADGGPLGGALHPALESFSDKDLEHLVMLIEDPAYGQFQAALTSPAVQRVMMASVSRKALLLGPALNAVLAKHGLKEVH